MGMPRPGGGRPPPSGGSSSSGGGSGLVQMSAMVAVCVILILITFALEGGEWMLGAAIHNGHTRFAYVGLGGVRLAAADSLARVPEYASLGDLCGQNFTRLHPHAVVGWDGHYEVEPVETSHETWCALASAGGAAGAMLGMAWLPACALLAATAMSALEELVPAFQRGLQRLRALGLTPAILDFVMLFLWGFLWVMLLLALTLYAHAAPATAGIGPAAFGHSFALARACLLLTSLAGMGVGAHVLQFWDEATVRELFAEIQGAGLLTLGLYTLLLCQAALYAVVALVEIDLGVLVCLVGVYYLVEKSAAVLVAYVVLAAATLPFDLLVVVGWKAANMDFWGWAAGTAYSFIIVLKAATLVGMVVRHTKVKCNFKFFGSNTHEELDA